MGKKLSSVIVAASIVAGGVGVASAAEPARVSAGRCSVHGAKLPVAAGTPTGLCRTIEAAIAARGVTGRYRVEVHILSPSSLRASLFDARGRKLPDQNFATMDRDLTRPAVGRFATSIASALEASGRR